jgi:hypothetical protein
MRSCWIVTAANISAEVRSLDRWRGRMTWLCIATLCVLSVCTVGCMNPKASSPEPRLTLPALSIPIDETSCQISFGSRRFDVTGSYLRECHEVLRAIYDDNAVHIVQDTPPQEPYYTLEFYSPNSKEAIIIILGFYGVVVHDTGRYPVEWYGVGRIAIDESSGERLSLLGRHFRKLRSGDSDVTR